MPIYAPSLPPRPDLTRGQDPAMVLARFELKRMFRHKVGLFFIFGFLLTLLVQIANLYLRHLMNTKDSLGAVKQATEVFFSKGAQYQAEHLSWTFLLFLWFFIAVIGGGLVSRDTLYRTRPLIFAHPVSQRRYLLSKLGFAWVVAFGVMLPFILTPWVLSLGIAGTQGPVWPSLPLRLVPAAALVALLMSAVAVGTSSLASTPRTGISWIIGVYLGSLALGALTAGLLNWPPVLSLQHVVTSWPQLICGVAKPELTWLSASLATLAHAALWLGVAWTRTRPSEATL